MEDFLYKNITHDIRIKSASHLRQGFTLMEILVATTIFVVVFASLLSLFDYVLKINRRGEALRQASQGMRNLMEYVVKQLRNGQVDYGFVDPGGTQDSSLPAPCDQVRGVGYSAESNVLGILDTDSNELCIYYGDDGSPIQPAGLGVFSAPAGHSYNLLVAKGSLSAQVLNPPNFSVDKLKFIVRPRLDAYTPDNPKAQPVVVILAKFTAKLPTGEQVPIYYQTSVSTSKYDIPNSP